MTRIVILLLFAAGAGCCSAEGLVIGPGDMLDIAVWNHKDLSMIVTVTPDGAIDYPLTGRLPIAGRTLEAVRSEISAAVARQIREPRIAVNMVESGSRVSVLGEVKSAGQFPLDKACRVSDALALAGGTTETAWLQRATLVRKDGRVETLDLAAILNGSGLAKNLELGAGDLILVPKLLLRVAVLGKVARPGSYDMTRPEATAIDAIAAAGGTVKGARTKEAVVVRRKDDVQTLIRIDAAAAASGSAKAADVALQDGDIIYVPESHRLDWDKGFQAIIGVTSIANLLVR